ncbi:hypothetical protein, variant 3 [Aphanomyces invadans]|uniref:Uncharacterized protein n=1 Tax=Aphanomyces invadans TaxID=157072 RepID=A0A024TMN5_9STRA|nr:hypothetical protein, variant 2 [Aphanomyces invadans]XP_008876937.1 hypothetical protein, variant 3 [Aphanomyces invadans]ETV94622.1 hypothetical protein, variant 2 [Aphanomyces invadans]ETV94623.1 hypothetical protein, variant 3 [Aphanomyces invadans]|eukprot:XP_008876935.1 hypothetical protein, variant 2 [Aphanomyces invadans]
MQNGVAAMVDVDECNSAIMGHVTVDAREGRDPGCDLAEAVYAARFPLGVNWKDLALELNCSPMDCVRRYAELKTPPVPLEEELQVVHSPRLDELLSSSHRSLSPMLSPPPFALRSEHRNSPFRWDEVESSGNLSLEDTDDLHAIEIEELSRDLSNASTHDALPLGDSSLTQSALEEAFLDLTSNSMPSMLLNNPTTF